MLTSFLFFLFSLFNASTPVQFGCINDIGEPVDYWVAIKKPQGTSYLYYDNKLFNTSPYSLNDTSRGALSHTIKQLWLPEISYVLYNDQVPKKDKIYNDKDEYDDIYSRATKYGHTKGFFAFDSENNGFWLTHSIPLFPLGPKDTKNYLGLGGNAWTYAQHLLCITVKANVLNSMANLFLLNKPQIYDSLLTGTTPYKNIQDLIDGQYSKLKVCDSMLFMSDYRKLFTTDTRKLFTTDTRMSSMTDTRMSFTLFAKSAEWNNDLYSACVTPKQQDSLWTETWIRGSAIGPVCPFNGYDTLDIKYLDFSTSDSSWSEMQDHSKWSITANKKTICMGDINRMTTQYSRGGGTVCFTNAVLHTILKTAVTDVTSCTV